MRKLQTLTESQRFGLRIAGVVSLLFIAAIALMVIPQNGILRDPINHTVMPSPFIKGIVPLIILFFFVVSLAYGIATRTIRRQADLPHLMIEPMKEMAGFIVMVFPLAQFVAMFNWSNMGKFIAVGLTDILESSGLSGIPAFVGLALLSSSYACLLPAVPQSGRFLPPFSYQCLCYLAFTRHLRKSSFVLPTHPYCL